MRDNTSKILSLSQIHSSNGGYAVTEQNVFSERNNDNNTARNNRKNERNPIGKLRVTWVESLIAPTLFANERLARICLLSFSIERTKHRRVYDK